MDCPIIAIRGTRNGGNVIGSLTVTVGSKQVLVTSQYVITENGAYSVIKVPVNGMYAEIGSFDGAISVDACNPGTYQNLGDMTLQLSDIVSRFVDLSTKTV